LGGFIVKELISRKQFLQRCALMGAAVVGGGSLLAGCGGGGDKGESGTQTAERTTAADPCGDTSGLSDAELQMRVTLKYVAHSTEEGKHCSNCKFFQPDQYSEPCGGCQLLKGPVNPDGYCTSWFASDQG
jgi:hypothetical protein